MENFVPQDGIYVDETTISRIHVVDFAEHCWRDESSVRIFIGNVQDVTDCVVLCPRDWVRICSQLNKVYGDAQQTIYFVTEAIVAWCKAIIGLATNASYSKWTREMIRNVDMVGSTIRLEIKIYQAESPSVFWSDDDLGFILSIPETKIMNMSDLVPRFKSQLLSTFINHELHLIPNVNEVKVPSELLFKPPYYLSIRASQTSIIVQSSHSPSLEFLAKYLRKNCRRIHKHIFTMKEVNLFHLHSKFLLFFSSADTVLFHKYPVINIKLYQSPFAPESSAIYDTLILKAELLPGRFAPRISHLILIHLVENELEYELDSSDQDSWHFRRKQSLEIKEPSY
ncbi:hypothetical protein GGI35DRAFT_473714 [Trichoderma velutinum]